LNDAASHPVSRVGMEHNEFEDFSEMVFNRYFPSVEMLPIWVILHLPGQAVLFGRLDPEVSIDGC